MPTCLHHPVVYCTFPLPRRSKITSYMFLQYIQQQCIQKGRKGSTWNAHSLCFTYNLQAGEHWSTQTSGELCTYCLLLEPDSCTCE
ncbi:hypothetical protein XELAEV_18023152mg [Xenopus laevis]|uniref:Uncharacterized protein n=1 Tax=Xenopus laevis TaxID=8355 RepID=A0A974HPF6_XENLA|nr:hypothetical protein XELAEV_18023152mg [Xenopus laevis]